MDIIKYDVYSGPNIGVFTSVNDKFVFVPNGFAKTKAENLAHYLQTEYLMTPVANTRLLGILMVLNNHGILLPGTPLSTLSHEFANARKMIASNLPIALATDCNPNCYTESMQLVQQLAVFRMNMTPAEALVASTINAAFAIGKTDRGCISEGWRADLLICDIPDYRHLTYHFGMNHVDKVIIGGKIIDA